MPDIKKDITKGIQDVQIDVGDDMSGLPSFGGDDSITIRNGNKPSHSPIIEIAGVCGTPYLRMTSMESFAQNKWRMDANSDYEVYKDPGGPTENSVKLKPFNAANGFVPVPSNSKAIKFPVKDVVKFKNGDLYYSANPISDYYEVYQSRRLPDENGLKSASVEYIKIPSENMDRIISLAKDITKNYNTPYDKIKAVESYLAENCSLDSGYKRGTQKNTDATFDLLFGSKKGNALNFMSTFVVLLKCADIPARINVGYQVDPGVNYQIVYADQLQVFAEVDFKEYGWVPISFLNEKGFVPPVSTSTEITQVENTAKKGSSFNVKGTVKDSYGKPVDGLDVLIFLKKDKNEGCLSYVKGHVTNGEFDVTGQLDRDIDVGTYNVVALSLENDKYSSSWSDPLMKVTAGTVIDIKAPQTVMEGVPFTISCSILEDMAAKPVKTGSLNLSFGEGIKPEISGKNVFNNGDAQNVVKLSVDSSLVPYSDYFLFNYHKTSYKVSYIGDEF
ncbi:MAG TPA: transglutaminase-like domain-containing protein, partial [Clostridia bacterium]